MASKTLKQNLIAALTALVGLITLASTLSALVRTRHLHIVLSDARFTVLAGLSLIYLATLLRRGKYNAWLISVGVFIFLLVRNIQHFAFDEDLRFLVPAMLNLLLPAAAVMLLIRWRSFFKVRSSLLNFGLALKRALLILVVAFLYGLIGFQLFDHKDFHQEISPLAAAHYTVDQFGLTTNNKPTTYTKRAVVFVDSLAMVSASSLFYVVISFFGPVRFRLTKNSRDLATAEAIMRRHSTTSEDFFKMWPSDKAYFFNAAQSAFIAYKVTTGVALAVGDPVGPKEELAGLIKSFSERNYVNGWKTAFIHTEASNLALFKRLGFEVQKIGQEAIVDLGNFTQNVADDKYFRQINNRFSKNGYACELLTPPHSAQIINRLRNISDDWLSLPGRTERGFMMGYFSEAYLQQYPLFVAKNQEGKIEAYLNQVTSPVDEEANYDLLRSARDSLGNINDFLMISFMDALRERGYKKLNMGLSPLAGIDQTNEDPGLINSTLKLVYTKADRFYSFQGLTRFKNKYQPDWQDRYIVYQGGIPGFGKTMRALLRAMSR